uniref:transmembrane protein 237-like n=1 Tax=Styela clava TaxID=7725 RepID=UPI001939CF65|nr:transmembrane protein 237-like [Styela clava]
MSLSEPRSLPPRALPPLTAGASHVGDGSQVPTPRKKTRPPTSGADNSPGTGPKRPVTKTRRRRSPRQQDGIETGSLQPSSAAASVADEIQMSEGSGPSSTAKPRTKRRRKPAGANQSPGGTGEVSTGNTVSALLQDEDVVNVEKIEDAIVMTNLPGVAAGSGGSAATDKVYVQTTNGFATHNQDWVNDRFMKSMGSEAQMTYGEATMKPSNIAEQNEKAFMFITLLLHGALAGFSIWQIVISYSLNGLGEQNLLTQYQGLAMPTQTVYYIILILCVVSAMDRYDFAARDKHIFTSLAKFDLASVAVIVYYVALMFSVGMVGLEAWIGSGVGITVTTTTTTISTPSSTQAPLPPELAGTNLDTSVTINTWLTLNVFRAVFACLGWLIIAFDPLRNDMIWE